MKRVATILTLSTLAVVLLVSSTTLWAQSQGAGKRLLQNRPVLAKLLAMKAGKAMKMRLRALDLSADQRTQVKGILAQHKGELKPLREQLRAARQQKDPQALQAAREAIKQFRQTLAAEVGRVLTPEQRDKIKVRRQAVADKLQKKIGKIKKK